MKHAIMLSTIAFTSLSTVFSADLAHQQQTAPQPNSLAALAAKARENNKEIYDKLQKPLKPINTAELGAEAIEVNGLNAIDALEDAIGKGLSQQIAAAGDGTGKLTKKQKLLKFFKLFIPCLKATAKTAAIVGAQALRGEQVNPGAYVAATAIEGGVGVAIGGAALLADDGQEKPTPPAAEASPAAAPATAI